MKDNMDEYTVGQILASVDLQESLIGRRLMWVHPSMSFMGLSGFKYFSEVVDVEVFDEVLYITLKNDTMAYMSSGRVQVEMGTVDG